MRAVYRDILEAAGKPPLWWDRNGTPRFAPFRPELCPNIYAKEVALLLIECGGCQKRFHVEVHSHQYTERLLSTAMAEMAAPNQTLEPPDYGDPPRHECQSAGETMHADTIQVLEFWEQSRTTGNWQRRPDLEIALRWVPKVEKGEE
jgi:hypothetical protein